MIIYLICIDLIILTVSTILYIVLTKGTKPEDMILFDYIIIYTRLVSLFLAGAFFYFESVVYND